MLGRPDGKHVDMDQNFIAEIIDRFIQLHPPNFTAAAKSELRHNVGARYAQLDQAPPSQILAALDLMRVLGDRPPNALALYIHRIGPEFTSDEQTCISYLEARPKSGALNEEQVSAALTYTTISQTQRHDPSVLVAALRQILPDTFRWQDVVTYFDLQHVRISADHFLRLYNALLPIAKDESSGFDIQSLWGGEWEHPETQLSFVCAFASLRPEQLDASTIPGLIPTFTLDAYAQSSASVRERAAYAVRHPLVSAKALSAVFNVALHSIHASQSIEAKRLFQEVVIPNLDIFVVSAFGVSKPWPQMALETLNSLFEQFLYKRAADYDFVLESIWSKDKDWVKGRLIDAHASKPIDLPVMLEHAVKYGWLDELAYIPSGFGLDLTALAHAKGLIDLPSWARRNLELGNDTAHLLWRFVDMKARCEIDAQRGTDALVLPQIPLQVRTVYGFLQVLEDILPKTPLPGLTEVQRRCITAYPRLINYGEGFDEIIDANGRAGNALSPAANGKMEELYKKMYGGDIQVRDVIAVLERYKKSQDPLDQDVFACMIHGLLDEYTHYIDYPLEALATTSVLFGGIISYRLVNNLPLNIGLGMILEAVRDHGPNDSMYKFGLQALMQLFSRLREWPSFCKQLIQIPGLQGTEAWNKAQAIVRDHDENQARSLHGGDGDGFGFPSQLGNEGLTNGKLDGGGSETHHPPPFKSIHVDPPPPGVFEDPGDQAQDRIQWVLNNLTSDKVQSMFREIREMLEEKHQQWFASHLVEARAKGQPNLHSVYLDLIQQFHDKSLWAEVLRETYNSVARLLNSEAIVQNTTERGHLKNLGDWLGRITLARDKPIKHKNIAFKELLIEAYDTDRLTVVIPFVCRVLSQGTTSNVFQPPNPWLMDIIHLLIELYNTAALKLNHKFEIEVLCRNLHLDHKSIEPSNEILNRVPTVDDGSGDMVTQDALESFENMSLNGMAPGMPNALSPHPVPPSIPDLGPSLQIPQTEVVNASRLHEIVLAALTRALQDIIQPVVDRSVTIAAISTAQMIRKDFCTEVDEHRVRTSAINMVKSTAGSLALVTSKEPLRANFTNYLRNLSTELPQGLPEGVIIMCVNSNLELASKVIETSAEERAVPEIEELIEPDLEMRRRHRLQQPNQPFLDQHHPLSRWALTIPDPYKLTPKVGGLNAEQMAIYEDFARQQRSIAASTPSHVPSGSDATRSLANEVLQDSYSSLPNLPTPAETPSLPLLAAQLHYPQVQTGMTNGRQAGISPLEGRALAERLAKFLEDLQHRASTAQEEHFRDLPRPHPVLDACDHIVQLIIKMQSSEDFVMFAAREIIRALLSQADGERLVLETLVHVLETVRRIVGPVTSENIKNLFQEHPGHLVLHAPLVSALLTTDLLDFKILDNAMATQLRERTAGSIELFEQLLDITLLNDHPLAMYAEWTRSLEEAWTWIVEEENVEGGQRFKDKLLAPPPEPPANQSPEEIQHAQFAQMDYVFEEWIHLCNNPSASERAMSMFVEQLTTRRVITDKQTLYIFMRRAVDQSVDRYEKCLDFGPVAVPNMYSAVDALVKLIVILLMGHKSQEGGQSSRANFLDSILALVIMVLSHHQAHGDHFNPKVYFRFFSVLLHEISDNSAQLTDDDLNEILLRFAARLLDLSPADFPGFLYQWTALLQHRIFMPAVLKMRDNAGWGAYLLLVKKLLEYLDELKRYNMMDPVPANVAKDMYRAVIKLMSILTHDFPDFVAANHIELCKITDPGLPQVVNLILVAAPEAMGKLPDPMEPGVNLESLPELGQTTAGSNDQSHYLRHAGLLDLLDGCLERGPSEDAIAQITHAISKPDGKTTALGGVPVKVDLDLVYAVTSHIGAFAVKRASAQGHSNTPFEAGSSDIKTLSMLVMETPIEARYYLLSSIINQLRFANAHTLYFQQALVEIFGHDVSDPDEDVIREQILRILFERVMCVWAHPWGLVLTIGDLARSDKFNFFDLPFIKSDPMVRCPVPYDPCIF
jgi:CCR4-NOT transcription complex subunit 1